MTVEIPISTVFKPSQMVMTVKITGLRWWMFRAYLATKIIQIGAWIAPFNIVIESCADCYRQPLD